ncbi:hypothetical protein EV401DRAFT_2084707 [Pisolithus croceorrhizus]|nr:hypothetical protein EV401DRAFT_2084707 [Pisolithus croceorrhizus]
MTVKNEISRHSNFYVSTVTFLASVEDSLFKVPREPFEKESEVFCDMFSLPQGSSVVVEGTSDENPIRIDRTSKDDFEQLLKALLHRLAVNCSRRSIEAVGHTVFPGSMVHSRICRMASSSGQSVLKLSTAWNFERLRQAAINALTESGISTVDRVVLSQRYYIKNWLLPALNELARRPEPITLEEAQRMGIDIALKLASVRERVTVTVQTHPTAHPPYSAFGASVPYQQITNGHGVAVGSCRDSRMQDCDFSDQIRSTFSAYEL